MAVNTMASGRVGTQVATKEPAERADHQPRREAFDDVPAHGAVAVVGAHAGNRGEHDGRHRGAQRQMHAVLERETPAR
jgi:hypothetical protein